MIDLKQIDKSWSLFLDRDGVINYDNPYGYTLNAGEFKIYPKVREAMKILSDIFNIIVMVTNQRGIGKGLMTIADLKGIHSLMMNEINDAGGRIDKIYFCSDIDRTNPNLKPNPGMAFQAKEDFPTIDFSKSIMVGNKLTDMQFGRNAGIATVFLITTDPETPFPNPLIDARFNNLYAFASALEH